MELRFLVGDATLFAREDYVEEAWRIVDPSLKANTPGGWHKPVITAMPAREGVLPEQSPDCCRSQAKRRLRPLCNVVAAEV